MVTSMRSRVLEKLGVSSLAAAMLLIVIVTGYEVPQHPKYSLALGLVVLLIGASFLESALIPFALLPCYLLVNRAGGGGTNLSLSDLAIFLATWPALFLAPRPFSRALRTLLWLSAAYQATLLFTLVVNPYKANYIEWAHEWLLVSGALVVGWMIGRKGLGGIALAILIISACLIAVATIITGLSMYAHGSFLPVYVNHPFEMNKNYIGTVLSVCAVPCWLRPRWLVLRRWSPYALALILVALAMTQARQAIVGLAVAMIIIALRRGSSRAKLLVLVGAVPALVVVVISVRNQLRPSATSKFSSANQRLSWFRDSIDIWSQNKLFGVGLRWWYTNRFAAAFQPPNGVLEVLTSAGLVGLAGFVLLCVGTLVVTARDRSTYGTIAFAVIVNRMVQGQLDIFWVAVTASLPFIIVGICLGGRAYEADQSTDVSRANMKVGI